MKRNFWGETSSFALLYQKIVLCLLTKCFILEPCSNIESLRRFYLGSAQTIKQVHREPQYGKKVFRKFQCQPPFPRKLVLHSSVKFGVIKP